MSNLLTAEQVARLNEHQHSGLFHPFTCGSGRRTDSNHLDSEGVLEATPEGWKCPYCDYRQPYGHMEILYYGTEEEAKRYWSSLEDDGKPLENGIVLSRAGGYRTPVYRCACGREQSAAHEGFSGGVSAAVVEKIGWRKIDGKWNCPFCTGNTENLRRVFMGE